MRLSTHTLLQPMMRRAMAGVFVIFGLGAAVMLPLLGGSVIASLAMLVLLCATAAAMLLVPVERHDSRWLYVLPALVAVETGLAMLVVAPDQGPVALVMLINGPLVGFMTATRGWLVGLLAFTSAVLVSATAIGGATDVSLAFAAAVLLGLWGFGTSIHAVWAIAERQSERLERLGQRDPLTGLGNRRLLDARLDYELARHARAGRELSVLALDLNGFKAVNDTLGHPAGDALLRDVASALLAAVREQDTVVRQGGDEFCVLAPETGAGEAHALAAAVAAALSGVDACGRPLSAGIGRATFPADATEGDALIARADARLLDDKPDRAGAAA